METTEDALCRMFGKHAGTGMIRAIQGEAADEIDRLREGLEIAEAWLRRWAVHVGQCEGGDRCTCGLTRIRYDAAIALQPKE